MDKKKYESPELEITIFETEDVITTSCPGVDVVPEDDETNGGIPIGP